MEVKIQLKEKEIPKQWYNLVPDLPAVKYQTAQYISLKHPRKQFIWAKEVSLPKELLEVSRPHPNR
jgi:predicted alternative tryptophan synthase beta-subunit